MPNHKESETKNVGNRNQLCKRWQLKPWLESDMKPKMLQKYPVIFQVFRKSTLKKRQ